MGCMGPEWVRHAVFYQIFPDRFARSPYDESGCYNFEDWNAPPTYHGYKGGTLRGLRDRLEYLQDLGITALYLNPVFQSTANHRYHTCDYFQIDPLLGGNEAFKELLAAAHGKGMRVILDGVFNHVGRGFCPFNDLIENGPASAWVNWFRVEQWPIHPYSSTRKPGYACWHNLPALPQLNHDNPDVRAFLFKVAEHWLHKGIDGWRLDAPECIRTPGFWEEFRARTKAINPDAYLVGEILPEAAEWLDGSRFDGVTNYLLYGVLTMFAGRGHLEQAHVKVIMTGFRHTIDGRRFSHILHNIMHIYPWEATLSQLNFLETHDVPRFLTVVGGYRPALETALVLLFTLPGVPTVYYGSEVGLTGADDPDCRRSFPPESLWDGSLLALHKQLIALRRAHAVLRTGIITVLNGQETAVCYLRRDPDATILVAVNVEISQVHLHLGMSELGNFQSKKILLGSGGMQWEEGDLTITLPPRGYIIVGG